MSRENRRKHLIDDIRKIEQKKEGMALGMLWKAGRGHGTDAEGGGGHRSINQDNECHRVKPREALVRKEQRRSTSGWQK